MFKYSNWQIRTKISVVMAIPVVIFVLVVDISPPMDKIEITPNAVNMELDCVKILDVKFEPSNADKNNLVYVSTDLSVARAEKGRIYSVGTGKAKVYAYDKKSGVQSDIIYVTVCTSIIDAEARKELAEEIKTDAEKIQDNVSVEKVVKEETDWTEKDQVQIYEAGKDAVVYSTKPENDETQEQVTDKSYEGSGGLVYISKSGTKYHKQNCSALKGDGTAILKYDAELNGKTACKKCNP